MAGFGFRSISRAALACAAAVVSGSALAGDLPATADGANAIVDFVKTYFGSASAQPPALVVKPDADDYLVSLDLAALTAPLAALGVSYDPATLTLKAFKQDDGAWRIEVADVPPIVSHQTTPKGKLDSAVTMKGVKSTLVLDPALGWVRSLDLAYDAISVIAHGPGVDESFDFDAVKMATTSKASADGAMSVTGRQSFGALKFNVAIDPKQVRPDVPGAGEPMALGGAAQSGTVDTELDGMQPKPILAAWAFVAAHPSRDDLSAKLADFKTLLAALAATHPSFNESGEVKSLTIDAPKGPISVAEAKFGIAFAASGPTSWLREHLTATGLALPDNMVPSMASSLVPTAFDVNLRISGFDANAAAAEAIQDLSAGDDGPTLGDDGRKAVIAKLTGAGPIVIEALPSRVTAPGLDLAFEGRVSIVKGGKPTGTFTVHMHDFDKTVTALKQLGPEAEKNMAPALAMAKGLAKTDPDGELSWVGEIGDDGVMKVNGLPLGKAPF